jgi:GxxExxY protein
MKIPASFFSLYASSPPFYYTDKDFQRVRLRRILDNRLLGSFPGKKELSKRVLCGVYGVHRALGAGLLEQPYHNALFVELKGRGCFVEFEKPYNVLYKGEVVGEYFADLVVDRKIIIEVKAVKCLSEVMESQLINYLRISGCKLGFLVNFAGSRVEFRRRVLSG